MLSVMAVLVVSALDHRFGWSQVPTPVVLLGDILVAFGLGIAMMVVIQNSYAAATIRVEAEQTVVSTGLYGLVRHPMYAGALIMMVGMPLALDSYWGLVTIVPGLAVLAFRINDEEKMLGRSSPGTRIHAEGALPIGAGRVVRAGNPRHSEEHCNDREPKHGVDHQRAVDFGLPHIDEIEYAAYQV